MSKDFPKPIRGENPVPGDGWPWSLTDYEVAYVQEFNSRPARPGWDGVERDEARLDDEAAGIRLEKSRRPRLTVRRSLVLVLSLALMLTGFAFAALGAQQFVTGQETLNQMDELKVIND